MAASPWLRPNSTRRNPRVVGIFRNLEERLKLALFHRDGRGISLTAEGATYHEAVASALRGVRDTEERLTQSNRSLTIACSYSVSHLLIMPHYSRLRGLLGEDVTINVLTLNYEAMAAPEEPNADIIIGYEYHGPGSQSQGVRVEDVIPFASPDYIAKHKDVLNGPVKGWRLVGAGFLNGCKR